MKKLDFIYFDAGGGHRSAANALRLVIEREGRPWEVRLVNLQELLDPLDLFRKLTGLRLQDVYNLMLKKGWTLGLAAAHRGDAPLIRLYHRAQVRAARGSLAARAGPDLVVSLVPNFNRAHRREPAHVRTRAPFVTVLTDMADYPPHFWIERRTQYLICGSERAVEQARAMGHPETAYSGPPA